MIKVNEKIWENHKGLKIGVLVIKNCNNFGESQEIMNLINVKNSLGFSPRSSFF